jgi:glycoprotein 6-alpha-L-fucosyltransferase
LTRLNKSNTHIIKKHRFSRYPHYQIYADVGVANTAQVKNRYTEESLQGIFADSKILSKCDFVVVTLSSNVGRLVYELLQIEKGDAAHKLVSVDYGYWNFRQHGNTCYL